MRKSVLILFVLTYYLKGVSQMYGAHWVLNYNTSLLDFRGDTIALDSIPGNMPMVDNDANICDSDGNLLFFTNGCYIAGSDGHQLLNGDSLSPCPYTNQLYLNGLNIGQASIFLPKPGSSRYYYLFSFSNDSADNLRPGTLFYSVIDKEGNSGLGSVVQKNIVAFHGILREGGKSKASP